MTTQAYVLYLLIIGCEAAFWIVLLASLAVRYLLHRETASRWLLRSLPLIDALLVTFMALDLKSGAAVTFAHGLAAAYVGFTIAFGSIAVRWADARFAHRFAAGPAPPEAPAGWAAVRFDVVLWLRSIVAWVITLAVLEGVIVIVGSDAVAEALRTWYRYALGSVLLWFVFGPAWSLVFFRRDAR